MGYKSTMFFSEKISSFDEIEQKAIEGDEKTIKSLIDMGCNLMTLFNTYNVHSKHPERRIETSQSLLFILLKLESPDLFNYAYKKLKAEDKNTLEDFYYCAWEDPKHTKKPLFTHYKPHPGSTSYKDDPKYHIHYILQEMVKLTKQSWNVDSLFLIREDAITFFNTYKKMDISKCEELFSIDYDLTLFFEHKRKTKQDFYIYPDNSSEKNIVDFLNSWEKNSKTSLLSLLKTNNIFNLLNRSKDNTITKWLVNDIKIELDDLYHTKTMNLSPQVQDYLIPLMDINKKSSSVSEYRIDFNYYNIDCGMGETFKEYMQNFILLMINPDDFLKTISDKDSGYLNEIYESIEFIQQKEHFLNLKSVYEKHLIMENTGPHLNESMKENSKKRI